MREELNLPADACILGTVSVLRSWKGQLYLLEALKSLISQGISAYLVIVGEGPFRPRIEEKIAELVEEKGLQKKYFMAKKGDVLIWHANLIHGGEAIRTKGATRKSMVAHYFCEGVICYHEISQRPALLQTDV